MKEMKYPEETIKSMESIMLGTSSTGKSKRSISDNNKKDPKKEDGLFEDLLNLIPNGDGIIDSVANVVKGVTNSVISGKGTLNYPFLSDFSVFCQTLFYVFFIHRKWYLPEGGLSL